MYVRWAVVFGILLAGTSQVFAQEREVKSIEVKPARPQVPVLGEIKKTKVPKTLFYKKQRPFINKQFLLRAGYLATSDRPFGRIIDSESEGSSLATGDRVFINRGYVDGVEPGKTYYIHRHVRDIKHPETKKPFGYIISVVGMLEVEGVRPDKMMEITGDGVEERWGYVDKSSVKEKVSIARIVKAYTTIFSGDYIVPAYRIREPVVDEDKPLADKKLEGLVIATTVNKKTAAEHDVIYLDMGRKDGVEEGDVFEVSKKPGRNKDNPMDKYGFKKRIGKAQVITVREDTSTAVVIDTTDEIVPGNRVSYLQERWIP